MSELVTIKSSPSGIELRLNANLPFPDLLKAVEEKFRQSADFFKNAKMAVSFSGRTLSISEEEQFIGGFWIEVHFCDISSNFSCIGRRISICNADSN